MHKRMNNRRWFLWVSAMVGIIGAPLFIATLIHRNLGDQQHPQPQQLRMHAESATGGVDVDVDASATSIQLRAILHYATSQVVPQLSFAEITFAFNVLQSLNRPANFLVFGLGRDSLMWAGLNPRGKTVFLEDDPKWIQTVLKDAPDIRAHTVRYRTQVREADELLSSYRSEAACWPGAATLRGNERCRLALHNLPDEVYATEWDVVIIDAPKGYLAEMPGRMAPIYSAAVMARDRKGSGVTHVFLHNVDRKEEKAYSEEFLCRMNFVQVVGKLGHFQIPPMTNLTRAGDATFC